MNTCRIAVFALPIYLSVCTSCKQLLDNAEETLKFANGNIAFSTKFIEQQNATTYHMLHEKLYDPVTKPKATIWEPKAFTVQRQSDRIASYLQNFEKGQSEKVDQLWNEIQKFKDSLLVIDPVITNEFGSNIRSFPESYDAKEKSETYIKEKLPNLSPNASKTFLNQLTSQVRTLENRLASFCLEQCPFNGFVFDSYSAIVGQSSSVVGAADEIKITAGVGAFSTKTEPVITIDGKSVPISEDGAAYYQFKAPIKVGKYKMPVKIEFSDRDGKRQAIQKIVEYAVVEK